MVGPRTRRVELHAIGGVSTGVCTGLFALLQSVRDSEMVVERLLYRNMLRRLFNVQRSGLSQSGMVVGWIRIDD